MRSVMKHFQQTPQVSAPRSVFDRSHGYKTTFDVDQLIPIYVDEALPGDTFNLKMSAFARLATPIYPIMDNLLMTVAFFAVPYRLVWTNFQKMMGEQLNPGDTMDYTIPQMVSDGTVGHTVGSLSDYFGIPTGVKSLSHSCLWHRAYTLVFNQWWRAANIQDETPVPLDDGPDTASEHPLQNSCKRFDYFTSLLPWPQRSEEDAASLVPVDLWDIADSPASRIHAVTRASNADNWLVYQASSNTLYTAGSALTGGGPSGQLTTLTAVEASLDPNGGLLVNLEGIENRSTINQLREAVMLQNLYELDARGGARYIEIIKAHFGVTSPDFRLQRSEYLGGGTIGVNIHPVPQNSPTSGANAQGDLAAFGTAAGRCGFTHSFTEHCLVLGLITVRPDLTYQQGLDRMFSRETRFDHYWPALAHLGEQAVLKKEIYAQGSDDAAADASVFGYAERWAEYRTKMSRVTGKFRSSASGTLEAWHLANDFSEEPALDSTFITSTCDLDRNIAVNTEPHFLFDSYFDLKCVRPIPTFSIPGFGTRF